MWIAVAIAAVVFIGLLALVMWACCAIAARADEWSQGDPWDIG
jgi:hypothetical protein